MTTTIYVSVKCGAKTTSTILEFEKIDGMALAHVEDTAHALIAHVERMAIPTTKEEEK
jgi:hypothetical protein